MRITTSLLLSSVLLCATEATSQGAARVVVVHGIPGLPQPVDVFVNGGQAFSFDYPDVQGPLALAPASYDLEVRLAGSPVLQLTAPLATGKNYTVIAHLKTDGSLALTPFTENYAGIASGQARVFVRHLAAAPAVDVIAQPVGGAPITLFSNVTNPNAGQSDVPAGTYDISLNAAGTSQRAFGPVRLTLWARTAYVVHAVGDLSKGSFQLVPVVVNPATALPLASSVKGKACAGKISLSDPNPFFGNDFDVMLSGGTPRGLGILHMGTSDRRFLVFPLPLDLSFLGATGCSLYQNTVVLQPVAIDGCGKAKVKMNLPASVASFYSPTHWQYSFIAPGQNRLGLSLTDYVTISRQ